MKTSIVTIVLIFGVIYCSGHTTGGALYLFQALCSHYDAYLANLETLEEALLIQYELKQMKTGIHYIVGGRNINRYRTGGDWRWVQRGNMTKMAYFAFGKDQPNGITVGHQDCMFLLASDHYQWHDIYCYDSSNNAGYICEK